VLVDPSRAEKSVVLFAKLTFPVPAVIVATLSDPTGVTEMVNPADGEIA
jgi:hypothetical protein